MKESIHIVRNTRGSFVGKTLISSDHHTPFESKKKTQALKDLIAEFKPNRKVLLGDVADTFLASRFVEDRMAAAQAQIQMPDSTAEFEYMVRYIDSIADVCMKANSNCELHYLRGNHEFRINRQLEKVRHLIGMHDPLLSAIGNARHKWNANYANYPHGIFVVCDDPKFRVFAKHAGRGTGMNHAALTWKHWWGKNASIIYGDTHKTMCFQGHNATNPQIRDNRFALGIGGIGDWLKEYDFGFGYGTEETRHYWDGGVACITQTKSGKFEIVVEYL